MPLGESFVCVLEGVRHDDFGVVFILDLEGVEEDSGDLVATPQDLLDQWVILGCNSIDTLDFGSKLGANLGHILGQIQN